MVDLPGDIDDVERIFPTSPVGTDAQGGLPTTAQPFSSFMKGQAPEATSSAMPSPFAIMQGGTPIATAPSLDTLMSQIQGMKATAADVQSQLGTANLHLKASTKYLLDNKLSETNSELRGVNAKLGVSASAAEPPQLGGPLGKFLGYLTTGQSEMDAAKAQLGAIKAKGDSMSPGDFLLVQLKLNKAQQLLEFSSVLLSTAVSDIKQMMQVQL